MKTNLKIPDGGSVTSIPPHYLKGASMSCSTPSQVKGLAIAKTKQHVLTLSNRNFWETWMIWIQFIVEYPGNSPFEMNQTADGSTAILEYRGLEIKLECNDNDLDTFTCPTYLPTSAPLVLNAPSLSTAPPTAPSSTPTLLQVPSRTPSVSNGPSRKPSKTPLTVASTRPSTTLPPLHPVPTLHQVPTPTAHLEPTIPSTIHI
jgi:hypothetical protein